MTKGESVSPQSQSSDINPKKGQRIDSASESLAPAAPTLLKETQQEPKQAEQQAEKKQGPFSLSDLGLDSDEVKTQIEETKKLLAEEAVADKENAELLLEHDNLINRLQTLEEDRNQKKKIYSRNPFDKVSATDHATLLRVGLIDKDAANVIKRTLETIKDIKAKEVRKRTPDDNRALNVSRDYLGKITGKLEPEIEKKREQTDEKNKSELDSIEDDFKQKTTMLNERLADLLTRPALQNALKQRAEQKESEQVAYEKRQAVEAQEKAKDLKSIQETTITNIKKLIGEEAFTKLVDTYAAGPSRKGRLIFQEARNMLRDAIMDNKLSKAGEVVPYYRFVPKGKKERVNYWDMINSVRSTDLLDTLNKNKDNQELLGQIKKITRLHDMFFALFGNRKKPTDTRQFSTDNFWETIKLRDKMMRALGSNQEEKAQKYQQDYRAIRKAEDQSIKAQKERIAIQEKKAQETQDKVNAVLSAGGIRIDFVERFEDTPHGKKPIGRVKGAIKFRREGDQIIVDLAANTGARSWLKEGTKIDIKRVPFEIRKAIIGDQEERIAGAVKKAPKKVVKNVRKRPRLGPKKKKEEYAKEKAAREKNKLSKKQSKAEKKAARRSRGV